MNQMYVLDLHCDTITRGGSLRGNGFHFDLDRLPANCRWCQTFAVFIPDEYRGQAALDYFESTYGFFQTQMEEHRESICQVRTARELQEAFEQGRHAALLSVEGGAVLRGSLEVVERLRECGVKMMTLTWNGVNEIGSGSGGNQGLTPFGKDAVAALEKAGIVVDVSHLNDPGFADVARLAKKPFIATHSDSRAICGHSRNLTDDQFRVIRDMGGLVGINFCTDFLQEDAQGRTDVSREQVMKHILHFLELGGEDTVAMGSDFDGTDVPDFIRDVSGMQALRETMLQAGLGEQLTHKLLFQNGMDFLTRYEKLR